jgi:uncharacterized protein YaaR (DUF327 family)
MTNATTLRTLVIDNSFELGRLTAEQLGMKDYKTLTALYTTALDALTDWAAKDYAHISTKEDADPSFTAVKAILDLYTTDDDRIAIDQTSMRTMRDCATKPKRMYSKEYNEAEKARRYAEKVVKDRIADLMELGAPAFSYNKDTFVAEDYATAVRESGVNTTVGNTDMLSMFERASDVLAVKTTAVEKIKAKGNWTWRRPNPVTIAEFADLVENYIADCLTSGFNMKSSKAIRDSKKEERAEAKLLKEKVEAEING